MVLNILFRNLVSHMNKKLQFQKSNLENIILFIQKTSGSMIFHRSVWIYYIPNSMDIHAHVVVKFSEGNPSVTTSQPICPGAQLDRSFLLIDTLSYLCQYASENSIELSTDTGKLSVTKFSLLCDMGKMLDYMIRGCW